MTDGNGRLSERTHVRRTPRNGFTLIELLVVIAIIGLLVSILLPSLSKARELARQSVCLSHVNTAGKSRALYENEYRGWLAGPNTSGLDLTVHGGSNKIEDVESKSTNPVQNMDWASPTMGNGYGFPANDIKRLVQILSSDLRCPTNQEMYDGVWPDNTGSGDAMVAGVRVSKIPYASYSSPLGFHVKGYDTVRYHNEITNISPDRVAIPDDYIPRMDYLGNAGKKIYLVEGCRYWNGGSKVTFNDVQRQVQGGNFMLYGPATPRSGDPHRVNNDLSLRDENRTFAWRHDGLMMVSYFDGHSAKLTVKESVRVDQYYPSGSVVVQSFMTQDPDDINGQEIP